MSAQHYQFDPNDVGEQIKRLAWRYRRVIAVVAVVALVVLVLSGSVFYSVPADSEAVVLRFGRYARSAEPGLRTKLPWPIESAYVVPVQRVRTLEFGFETLEPGQRTRYAAETDEHLQTARMLTGDLNLAHVEWIVQYRIKNARDYLFNIGGGRPGERLGTPVAETIRDVSEAVMRRLVGDASVDEVITIAREEIAAQAKLQTQKMLDGFGAGVRVVTVKLQAATPPESVKDAFDEVNRARQRKERVVNEAEGERNRQVPAARGRRDQAISEAEGYRERVVMQATGQANAFLSRLAEFEKAPEITRKRLYLEAMQDILTQVEGKLVVDESIRSLLPLLEMGEQLQGRKEAR
jgi:membrane protease subunit HflK